jgi:membrane-bound inhibitor of C-type lysozyme
MRIAQSGGVRAAALVILGTGLAACAGVPALGGRAPGPPAPGAVLYACDDGSRITATYRMVEGMDTARLQVGRQTLDLRATRAASGVRYAAERGLAPDTGVVWWTRGAEAMLMDMPLDDTFRPGDETLRTTCREVPR